MRRARTRVDALIASTTELRPSPPSTPVPRTRSTERGSTRQPSRRMIIPNGKVDSAAVAAHYDNLDRYYRELWGEHVHHGLWRTGRETPETAVRQLIDLVAD